MLFRLVVGWFDWFSGLGFWFACVGVNVLWLWCGCLCLVVFSCNSRVWFYCGMVLIVRLIVLDIGVGIIFYYVWFGSFRCT